MCGAENFAEAEGGKYWQLQILVVFKNVAERVRARVVVFFSIRCGANADAVEDNQQRAHQTPMGCQAVLNSTVSRIQ